MRREEFARRKLRTFFIHAEARSLQDESESLRTSARMVRMDSQRQVTISRERREQQDATVVMAPHPPPGDASEE